MPAPRTHVLKLKLFLHSERKKVNHHENQNWCMIEMVIANAGEYDASTQTKIKPLGLQAPWSQWIWWNDF